CIADRQRGGKYDAFAPYRDPIANARICSSASTSVPSTIAIPSSASGSSQSTADWPLLAIPAALLAAAVMS
ncbi:MAG: hypothetical protein M3N93_11120, partial [Acidobacteriota bacterium]|nr:hypothetical protein [Acidobacteriota bacterium]